MQTYSEATAQKRLGYVLFLPVADKMMWQTQRRQETKFDKFHTCLNNNTHTEASERAIANRPNTAGGRTSDLSGAFMCKVAQCGFIEDPEAPRIFGVQRRIKLARRPET
jgi:hypothetical protein